MDVTPVWRPTARIFVLDPLGRVLLFSSADPAGKTWWFTPGGGVRRGETLTAAAVREPVVDTGGQEELERSVITGHRWWTVDDLRHAVDEVFPYGLGDLIAGVLADGVPERPVRLQWR